ANQFETGSQLIRFNLSIASAIPPFCGQCCPMARCGIAGALDKCWCFG
uniref:Uncharacterized protein n=1 Tax=Triticum urartu TaxID=4572 RepID=A0A8R7PW05_TRIUA